MEFASDDPAAQVRTVLIVCGFELGAAGFDGGGEHGRGHEGEGLAAGTKESDADAAFAEFF